MGDKRELPADNPDAHQEGPSAAEAPSPENPRSFPDCLAELHDAHTAIVDLYRELLAVTQDPERNPAEVARQVGEISARELQLALRLTQSSAAAIEAATTPEQQQILEKTRVALFQHGQEILLAADSRKKPN